MTSLSSFVIGPAAFTATTAIPRHAPAKKLAWHGNAVASGGLDPVRISGAAAWLGAGAQRLARRVVYQLNSRSVLCFFREDR